MLDLILKIPNSIPLVVMPSPVAVLLTFANDWVDDARHLRNLLDESKAIVKVLAPLVEAGRLSMPAPIHNATVEDVTDTFRARRYRDQIRIFHFGGHANASTLLFEDKSGNPSEVHAKGLAGYLGQQQGLVLVFLNGCSTEPQIRSLREAGVKAVVATTWTIQDAVAAEFAAAFYAELAARPLREAFDTAVHELRMRWGDDPRAVTREIALPKHRHLPELSHLPWPWIFECDPGYESWTLGSEPPPGAGPAWRRRLLLSAVAILSLLTMSLILSADARRTTCRARGLRSLCTAIGIGEHPTPSEESQWSEALHQRSGDGLRAYLRSYPAGAHTAEAIARLGGCRLEREETVGADREVRYVLAVNPNRERPWPTETEARGDALARGHRDAATTCEPLKRNADLLSVRAEPRDWRCMEHDHAIACGFDGEIVCRVRDRILSEHERCHDN